MSIITRSVSKGPSLANAAGYDERSRADASGCEHGLATAAVQDDISVTVGIAMIDNIPVASGPIPMSDPLSYFFTVPTYGTWLPGDQRGWVMLQHGWQLPRPKLELASAARMTKTANWLSPDQIDMVEQQIQETSCHRGWTLHARACLSNHMHFVISAFETDPKKIRSTIKSWCTQRLKISNPRRKKWWADRGSIRWIWNQASLDRVIEYTNEAQ